MDGSPAFGLGGRVGYEWLSTKFGASVAAGPTLLQTTGGPCELQPFFDFRVTLWNVKR